MSAETSARRQVLVLFDHEEVGSVSERGAYSALLPAILERIVAAAGGGREELLRALAGTVIASGDMAHATNPNYADKHEPQHRIEMNAGPVLKINHNLRYATDSLGAAEFRLACEQAGAPGAGVRHPVRSAVRLDRRADDRSAHRRADRRLRRADAVDALHPRALWGGRPGLVRRRACCLPGAIPVTADPVIRTTGLRKTYVNRRGRHVAVDGLDLAVPAGGVHGFLGPNGSGKTTTIRMVLGLARADAGEIRLFDVPVPERLPAVIGRVGAVVEQPRLFPGFTGRRNLELLARSIGVGAPRVDAVLERVGLRERGADRYRSYSLGMKQRLAIAATLLNEPDLLVLDEPTNGLDPSGIREVRGLVRDLAAGGTTVLISSHILAEVQQVCDSVSIIGRGRLLAGGSVADVLSGQGGPAQVRVRVNDLTAAADVLTRAGFSVAVDDTSLLVSGAADPAALTRALANEGHYVSELVPIVADLESVFLQITEGEGL